MLADIYHKLFPKKKIAEENIREKSRHETMTECLEYSKRMLGKRFSVRVSQVVEMETISPNILAFNQELMRLNRILKNNGVLKPADAIFEYRTMTLEKFFIDESIQSYISQSEYRRFHELSTEFTALTLEASKAEYGPLEHNYRALSKVIRSIIQICQAIDKATQ